MGNFIQAVANTAGFHFAWIEQDGTSLYPKFAQRASNVEVLRVLLSIGGTEICHFQTWHDKAGNAKILANVIDPMTHVSVTFPDLNSPPFGGEDFQTNLIMPEPTAFLSRRFPPCSIIRPTETRGRRWTRSRRLPTTGCLTASPRNSLNCCMTWRRTPTPHGAIFNAAREKGQSSP
jgi:hypothetical protein